MNIKNVLLALEKQVDKIVLGVFVLLALFFLWVYVVRNPYGAKVDGRKVTPSNIDRVVKQKADNLKVQLGEPSDPIRYDKSYASDYKTLLQCPFEDIDAAMVLFQLPRAGTETIQDDRLYTLPDVPALADVKISHLRGAAQIPAQLVSPDIPYKSVPKEVDDLDLVTISSRFDVQRLYNNFQQSFAGPRLKSSWKDPRLAIPVFARMDLQRRAQQEDGIWGQWKSVSRTQIDAYQKLLKELPEVLDQSQYGVEIWSSQYNQLEVQMDILQPESYSFVISRVEWMPPEFIEEALDILAKEEEKAKRERLEQLRDRQNQRTTTDRRTTGRRQTRNRPEPTDRRRRQDDDMMMNPMMGMGEIRPARRTVTKERTLDDVEKDLDKVLLTDKDNLSALRDPLLVWAHDDTAEPGMTYQYRIRLGVFNPIAGMDWFREEQADYKNQLILWSAFSEPTEAVSIPRRVYVFPSDVVAKKDTTIQTEAVQVEVAKYQMGRWHDYEFEVLPGQIIGYEVEDPDEQDEKAPGMMMEGYEMMNPEMTGISTAVDFSTGYTLVDVSKQTLWNDRLQPKTFRQMLYCNDDQDLKKIAIGKTNWDSQIRKVYADIQDKMERSVEQRTGGMSPMMPGMPMGEGMMDPMMMGF